ncbi:WG repeat-containing protein [Oscillatoriales cyanobacterium LEGE 11467]|uniref:WG repeat-containing protein n=1 Tax=Zarconia navalis LEGE 11467 TaxID=1828826 RepID=A0A928Z617_9CYAN|nr:WG repeat-containing protein [Zarconia navalis]MBE9039892.1 WG repeat-containing protein [Zarconia navalis LEGE 11467]
MAKVGDAYGYLDTNGNDVIPPQFEEAKSFSQGLAAVKDGGKWGYLDTQGNWAIAPQFEAAGDFSEEGAIVTLPSGKGIIARDGTLQVQITRADVQALLPTSVTVGNVQISPFADGLARVTVELEGGRSDRIGFIDGAGNWAISLQEHPILDFSEGLAAIEIDGKYGYVDKTGQIAIAPQFKKAQPFSEGLAAVEFADKQLWYTWGYIDRSGETEIAPQFYSARSFSESLAGVGSVDRGSGYLDRTGTMVISRDTIPEFREGFPFSEGFARVRIGDWLGYIDRDGNIVIEPQYASAFDVSEGMARVDISGQWVDWLGGYDGTASPIYEARLEGSKWGYIQLPVR